MYGVYDRGFVECGKEASVCRVSGVGKHIRDEKYVNAKIGLEIE